MFFIALVWTTLPAEKTLELTSLVFKLRNCELIGMNCIILQLLIITSVKH